MRARRASVGQVAVPGARRPLPVALPFRWRDPRVEGSLVPTSFLVDRGGCQAKKASVVRGAESLAAGRNVTCHHFTVFRYCLMTNKRNGTTHYQKVLLQKGSL